MFKRENSPTFSEENDRFKISTISNVNFMDIDPAEIYDNFPFNKLELYNFLNNHYKEYFNKYHSDNDLKYLLEMILILRMYDIHKYLLDNLTKEQYLSFIEDMGDGLEFAANDAVEKGYVNANIFLAYMEEHKNNEQLIINLFNQYNYVLVELWKYNFMMNLIQLDMPNFINYLFSINYFDDIDYKRLITLAFQYARINILQFLLNMNKPIINIGEKEFKIIDISSDDIKYNNLFNTLIYSLNEYNKASLESVDILPFNDNEKERLRINIIESFNDKFFSHNLSNDFIDIYDIFNQTAKLINIINMLIFDNYIVFFIENNGLQEEIRFDIIIEKNANRSMLKEFLDINNLYITSYKHIYILIENFICSIERIIKKYEQKYRRPIMIIPKLTDNPIINGVIITNHI